MNSSVSKFVKNQKAVKSSLVRFFPSLHETFGEKVYRWLDITGYFTRFGNRKAHLLYRSAVFRSNAVLLTEYERKFQMFMDLYYILLACGAGVFAYWFAELYFNRRTMPYYPQMRHYKEGKVPNKVPHFYANLWTPGDYGRCRKCLFLDTDCKRECYDYMRAEGKSDMWGLKQSRLGYLPTERAITDSKK
eukprot:Filipodium_phascolosomae@DN1647_c0_g1_i4.p1